MFILNFWSSQCLRLLRPCIKWRGRKKIKSTSFHQYSWNSEVETTWISMIGWHNKTSKGYGQEVVLSLLTIRLEVFILYILVIHYITLHQLQIVRSSKRMKFLIVFVAFFGLAFGSDLFVGSWKEDQYKREGLSDYIYERGIYTKYSKHWPYTVAHTIDCVCRTC